MSLSLYEVNVQVAGEGYSMRRVRVKANSPEEAKKLAVLDYMRHIVSVGEPKKVERTVDNGTR